MQIDGLPPPDQILAYMEQHIWVQDAETKGSTPFMALPLQRRMILEGKAARLSEGTEVVVKPRQIGSSTLWLALCATLMVKCPGLNILWVNLDDDGALEIREKFNVINESLMDSIGSGHPGKSRDSAGQYKYSNGSRIVWAVAGEKVESAENVGRGGTFHLVVYCEFAYWKHPRAVLDSLGPALEHSKPTVIVDSTPNGVVGRGALYHRFAKAAYDGQPGYQLMFFPWYEDPRYRMILSDEEEESVLESLTADEEMHMSIASAHGCELSAGQIAWYRKMELKYGPKVEEIYPPDFDSAFIKPGNCAFDESLMRSLARRVASGDFPVGLGGEEVLSLESPEITRPRGDILALPKWGRDDVGRGCCRVWVPPLRGKAPFFLGIDASEGGPTGDWQVATVVDADMEVCARLRTRVSGTMFAAYVQRLAMIYRAYLLAEGEGTTYHVYHRLVEPVPEEVCEKYRCGNALRSAYPRWIGDGILKVNVKTRPILVEGLIDDLNSELVEVKDKYLYVEMSNFREDQDTGVIQHAPGTDDDALLSLAFALWARHAGMGARGRETRRLGLRKREDREYGYLGRSSGREDRRRSRQRSVKESSTAGKIRSRLAGRGRKRSDPF